MHGVHPRRSSTSRPRPHTHTARPQFPIRTISISRHLSGQNPPNELGRGEAQMDVAPPYVRTYYVVQCTHVLVHSEHWAGKKCWPISWRKLMLLWQAQSQKEGNGGTEKNWMPQTDMIRCGNGKGADTRPFSVVSSSFFLLLTSTDEEGLRPQPGTPPLESNPTPNPGPNPRNIEHARRIGYATRRVRRVITINYIAQHAHCLALCARRNSVPGCLISWLV